MKKIFHSHFIGILLLIIPLVASSQITSIDVTNKNSVCTNVEYSYPIIIGTGKQYITITNVTISPSNVYTSLRYDINNIRVIWNDNIVNNPATITLSYIVLGKTQYVFYKTSGVISAKRPIIYSLTGKKDPACNLTGSEYYQVTTDGATGIYWTPPSGWKDISHDTRMDVREFSYPLTKAGNVSVTVENRNCNIAQTGTSLRIDRLPQAIIAKSPTNLSSIINQLNTFEINAVPNAVSYDWSVTRKVGDRFYEVPEKYYTKNVSGTLAQYTFFEDGHYRIVARYVTDAECINSCNFDIYVNCIPVYNFPACNIAPLIANFGNAQGFVNNSTTPRLMADLNNDNRDDAIGFHPSGVFVAFSNKDIPYSYFTPKCVVANYGTAAGWTNMDAMPRYFADVDGNGYLDIVGFFQYGVAVSLNNGNMTFAQPQIWYVYDANVQLTSFDALPRQFIDMNHDEAADIVLFGLDGVYIAYSDKGYNKFKKAIKVCSEYGYATYNSQGVNPRLVTDINNDTWPDLVCIEQYGISASINNGGIFANIGKISLSDNFGSGQGFPNLNVSPRFFIDMNKDTYKDIVGISNGLVFVSINNQNKTFQKADIWTAGYGVFQDETNIAKNFDNAFYKPITIADIDGDLYPDIIGFNSNFTVVSKNMAGQKFDCPEYIYAGENINNGTKHLVPGIANIVNYPSQDISPRYLVNLDGDTRKDIVAFNSYGILRGVCYPSSLRVASDDETIVTQVAPIKAYPNPATDNFNIEINYLPLEENTYKILIYDINGSLVSQKDGVVTKDDNSVLLDLSSATTGLYFYKVYLNNEVLHTDKLIIE